MVQVGNESGSELVLTGLGKGFDRDQVELTLKLLEAADLPYTCFLLLGGPGETPETVQESVALLERYEPKLVNLKVGIRIHPGLPLHRLALAEGVVRACGQPAVAQVLPGAGHPGVDLGLSPGSDGPASQLDLLKTVFCCWFSVFCKNQPVGCRLRAFQITFGKIGAVHQNHGSLSYTTLGFHRKQITGNRKQR